MVEYLTNETKEDLCNSCTLKDVFNHGPRLIESDTLSYINEKKMGLDILSLIVHSMKKMMKYYKNIKCDASVLLVEIFRMRGPLILFLGWGIYGLPSVARLHFPSALVSIVWGGGEDGS